MFDPEQYQLLDFGQGRRLERFGAWVLDRPCPAAEGLKRADPAAWAQADARFHRTSPTQGRWELVRELPERWVIAHGPIRLELKRAESGHVGVFPEQAVNWDWIASQVGSASQRLVVLNLFAYTGGSTLAAAAAGAEVVHVDAAQNVVAWARRNAELSGLADLAGGTGWHSGLPGSVRWIAEDAMKFARRELRRQSCYDAVILDPPSYGHGPRGEVWRLSKHLGRLLELCGQLTAGQCRFMLLTCHTPNFEPARLARLVRERWWGADQGRLRAETLVLRSASGRGLPSGAAVYWEHA
ncbi:MAG: class I SAM-dependent methyltransferase [Thermoguttaceae bacterium]